MKTIILDTDGSVKRQRLHEYFIADTINLSDLRDGLQFYADKRSIKECAKKIKPYASGPPASFLLGSGDFHHLTLLILEQLRTPFVLIVFDNHTDCSFPYPKYHCGNWIYHAARLTNCKKTILIGATEVPGILNRLISVIRGERNLAIMSGEQCNHIDAVDNFTNMIDTVSKENYPVYVSIDKDVLGKDESPSDWDNGVTRTSTLTRMLRYLVNNCILTGADITGEMSGKVHYRSRPLKNLLSSIEHRICSYGEQMLESDIKHKTTNLELLEILGAEHA